MIRSIAAAAAVAVAALSAVALAEETPPAEAPAAVAAPAQAPAFTTACPALPPAPAIPDGSTARERDMTAAEATMQAWNAQYVGIINDCRQAEVRAHEARLREAIAATQAARAEYDAALAAYNQDSAVATNAAAQWMAEVEEFNNRRN